MMNKTDVVVIGAGMAGSSLAWRLAQSGVQVTLLERESQPGTESTGRSAAMFMESYGPAGVRALTRAGREFYLHPPAGFAAVPLLHRRPTLYVAMADQQAALDRLEIELTATGAPLERVGAYRVEQLVPALRAGRFTSGLFDKDSYDIDVDALLQGFLRGAKKGGARVLTSIHPVRASQGAEGWTVELSDGASLAAGVVVDAAGAWADEVAALFGVQPIGLQPKRRSAFTFNAPAGVAGVADWPMTVDIDEHWYFKPESGQLLGSPANADPTVPQDVQPEQIDIAVAIDRIQTATTMEIRRPNSTWAGLRSFVPDGEIVIGFDDKNPGFFWLAGQGGYGIQSAAGASLLASCLVQKRALPGELTKFGVDPAQVSPLRLRR